VKVSKTALGTRKQVTVGASDATGAAAATRTVDLKR
jgi:hypothetical protein